MNSRSARHVAAIGMVIALAACSSDSEPEPPGGPSALVIHANKPGSHGDLDVTAVAEMYEMTVRSAPQAGGRETVVRTCAAKTSEEVRECIKSTSPTAVVATTSRLAQWVQDSNPGILVTGPEIDSAPGGFVPAAHSDATLGFALADTLAGSPECSTGIATIGPRDTTLERTVAAAAKQRGLPDRGHLSELMEATTPCVVLTGVIEDPSAMVDASSSGSQHILGLVESSFTADVQVALSQSDHRVIVASSFAQTTGPSASAEANELLERGRSFTPDFIADPSTLAAHIGLTILGSDLSNVQPTSTLPVAESFTSLGLTVDVIRRQILSDPYIWTIDGIGFPGA